MRIALSLFACAALAGCGPERVRPEMMVDPDMALPEASCTDGVQNGNEGDVDCGGKCPNKCAENQKCKEPTDCDTGKCIAINATEKFCFPPNICVDKQKNGDETGVDCGGSCGRCPFDQGCAKPTDCISGVCTGGLCAALRAKMKASNVVVQAEIDPRSPVVADFNGDGKADIAVMSGNEKDVYIVTGKGDGLMFEGPPSNASCPQSDVTNPDLSVLAAGDLDGDGKPDLVATGNGNVYVMLNTTEKPGDAEVTFARVKQTTFGSGPASPILADMDGDGKLDLVTTDTEFDDSVNGYAINVMINNGSGTWKPGPKRISTGEEEPTSTVVADFTGDGKRDIAVLFKEKVNVFGYAGDYKWDPVLTFPPGVMVPWRIAAGDVDNDGNQDIAVVDRANDMIAVLRGLGQDPPDFEPGVRATALGGPVAALISNFDLDGYSDLVVSNFDDDTVQVYYGRDQLVFVPGVRSTATVLGAKLLLAADLNGDGRDDFIIDTADPDGISVVLNTSTP